MSIKRNLKLDKKILLLIGEGCYQSKLARILKVSPTLIVKYVKRLEKEGRIRVQSKYPKTYELIEESQDNASISSVKGVNSMLGRPKIDLNPDSIEQMHSAHKIKFSLAYKGIQPKDGIIKPFGRTRKQFQVVYRWQKRITITAFKNRLVVWVHNPPGIRTKEQIIKARTIGYLALVDFAKQKQLALQGNLESVLYSHHVIEDSRSNEILTPLFDKYGKEIDSRIGSKVCKTSHKGKIEHEGKPDRHIKAVRVAEGLEYLTLDFPKHFAMVAMQQNNYDRNIRKHLKAIDKISSAMDAMRRYYEGKKR